MNRAWFRDSSVFADLLLANGVPLDPPADWVTTSGK